MTAAPPVQAWLDVSAGAAGDMILGALLDAGASFAAVQAAVDAVIPGAVHLTTASVDRAGQRATKLEVELREASPHHRTWTSIRTLLHDAPLDERVRALALRAFGLLADAEGRVHGVSPEDVHFHEVGALDSIADVVGVCAAVVDLGIETLTATPVALGEGRIRAAHGAIPVPVPAVAQLALGWPVLGVPTTAHSAHAVPAAGSVDAAEHAHQHAHEHTHTHTHTLGDDHHHEHGNGNDHHEHEHGHSHDHTHTHTHTHPHEHSHAHRHDEEASKPRQAGELATPTGLALVRALASEPRAAMPALVPHGVGVGAGTKDFPGWPNVVRVVLGRPADATVSTSAPASAPAAVPVPAPAHGDVPPATVVQVHATVDDLDPRLWPGVLDALLGAGAVDAWLTPVLMKKGRPGHVVTALTAPDGAEAVEEVLLAHTTTLGTRRSAPMQRRTVERVWRTVRVDLAGTEHEVRIKLGLAPAEQHGDDNADAKDAQGRSPRHILTATPEFADVARAAAASGLPEVEVLARARAGAAARGLLSGGSIDLEG